MSEPIPHDNAAENAILQACMIDGSAYDRVKAEGLNAADFYQPRQRLIFETIERMHGSGVDTLTVTAELRLKGELDRAGGIAFVTGLLDSPLPDIARVEQYAQIIRDQADRRRFALVAQRIHRAAVSGQSMAEVATDGANLCAEIARGGMTRPEPVRAIAHRAITRLDERMTSADPMGANIRTPIHGVNMITNGIPRGVSVILAARVAVGKTAMSIATLIDALRAGKRVLLVELDMSESMIGDRLLAAVAGVSAMKVRTGRGLDSERDLPAIRDAAQELGGWGDRLIVDTRSRNIAAIAALIRREARVGLDLVIVDHIGHVRGGAGDARYLQLGDVSATLIEVAAETNVALLNLAQLGRDAAQREPILSDLRESGNLEQDARIVLLLDRPGLRDGSIPQCRLDVVVAKNEGEAGHVVEAHFDLRSQRITDRREAHCAYCSPTTQQEQRGRDRTPEGATALRLAPWEALA